MANSDCIVIQGSNMAEAHPVGFQWVAEAKARGARVIHVDPRFSRTSAVADKHLPIRAGSDVVLLGALIKYIIDNELYFRDYVVAYTNAATLVREDFEDTEDLDGLFSGYNPETGEYDTATWQYATKPCCGDASDLPGMGENPQARGVEGVAGNWTNETDETLTHPRCVFQVLKRHYQRYTPELVEQVCGIPKEDFYYLADAVTRNSGRERTTCFAYAVGWTQHTLGAQFIRTSTILQLLLGNIGRPGGGIMALRGHASIQGSTDIPTLFHLLPGYIPMPKAGMEHLSDFIPSLGDPNKKGFWANGNNYAVSLLKSYFGKNATKDNEFGYQWLPRLDGPLGTYQTQMAMMRDEVDGYFVFGQNPVVGSAHGRMQRDAMRHLKWLVVRDFQLIETATFWKDSPEILDGEIAPEDIDTEVFFLPAATHVEKAGTFTQTQRMVQWRHQAIEAPGEAEAELEFFYHLGEKIRERVADSTDPRDLPLQMMSWDYTSEKTGDEPDPEMVLREINGYHLEGEKAGQLVSNFNELKDDGSTSSGCWIYAGVFADNVNHADDRVPGTKQDSMASKWGWVWPANRRILYNRASADPDGKPWSERKKLIWWDEERGEWVGPDVPDFPKTLDPHTRPEKGAVGPKALSGTDAFIMQPDGKGWLFAPEGVVDGPLPTHYEAQESPVENPVYRQQKSPTRRVFRREDNLSAASAGEPGAEVYPVVMTTYRLTEHHTAGGMSRYVPYLSELQPEMFVEVSPELAEDRGLENGEYATIISPRAVIEARVLVTNRFRPLTINGKRFHQIGLPYHWGQGNEAVVRGDSANDLLGLALDPNVQIQESKVASCEVLPGRRPRGPERDKMVLDYQRRAGLTTETGNQLLSYPENTPPPGPGSAGELHGEHGGADPGAGVERSAEGVDPDGPDETEDGDPAARGKKRDDKKGRSRDENERRDDDSHDGDEGGRK